MDKLILKVEKRKITGRKVGKLRREGVLPANIYGKKVKSLAVQTNLNEFDKVFKKVGETGLVELQVNGEKRPVLIHNIQLNPVTDVPQHVDFLQVNLLEKVTAQVPVEVVGESPAEKQGLGTVVQYIDEIEVEALPTDLPDKFEIDRSNLIEVGQLVTVADLPIDKKKVEVKADLEQILVKVEPPRKEEEVAPPPTPEVTEAPSEGEVEAQGEVAEVKEGEEKKEE